MELPDVFIWVALVAVGALITSLFESKKGRILFSAALLLLSVCTLGYGLGVGYGRERAQAITKVAETACRPVYKSGGGVAIPVDACRDAQANARMDLINVRMPVLIGMGAVLALIGSLVYLAKELEVLLARLKRVEVAPPKPADQQNKDRPEERDGRDG